MADASFSRAADDLRVRAQAAVAVGKLWQLPDGRAGVLTGTGGGVYSSASAAASGDQAAFSTSGQYVVTKTAGVVLLDGGRVYWDRSAAAATYKKVNDRDFLLGRAVGDAASADLTCTVNLNVGPDYDLLLHRDPFVSALVGTQAAGGFGGPYARGGATKLVADSTNEAQKVDALGRDGFAVSAKAVVEMALVVVSVGSGGTPDCSVGLASATHATDADSIAQHLFCHLDGNATAIKFQSKDGTHTTAATDSTVVLVAGTRFEVWLDLRDSSAVKLYIDGVQVLSGTTFNVSSAAGPLYLLAHLEKTSSADTFEIDIDWLRARFAEQRG